MQVRKLRLREVEQLAKPRSYNVWYMWDLNRRFSVDFLSLKHHSVLKWSLECPSAAMNQSCEGESR